MVCSIRGATLAVALFTAAPATAADRILEPLPDIGQPWTAFWYGFGGGAGGSVGTLSLTLPPLSAEAQGLGGQGSFGEFIAGADVQLGERLLVGVFGDYQLGGPASHLNLAGAFDARLSAAHGYDLGGRAGILISPETLAYALAAYSHRSFEATATGFSTTFDLDGVAVGGGIETSLFNAYTLRGEYRLTHFDTAGLGIAGAGFTPTIQTVHGSINYRFGQPSRLSFDSGLEDASFTGFRLGVAGGYGMINHRVDVPALAAVLDGIGGEGTLFEVSARYDVEWPGRWVTGLGGDYRWGALESTASAAQAGVFDLDASLQATHGFDIYGRLGYRLSLATMLYGLAGYGWQDFAANGQLTTGASTFTADHAYTTHGVMLGAGLETALNERVSVSLEYRYADHSADDFKTGGLVSLSPTTQTVRAGLHFRLF